LKLLVVRRDNIGDLVLTTPVLRALRSRFPAARIDAFVNSYNAPVLAAHPDVDTVHAYTKAKHLEAGAAGNWIERVRQVLALRAQRYDHVIVATPGYQPRQVRFARWLAPAHIAAFVPPGARVAGVDLAVAYDGPGERHHVEDTFRILAPLGIEGAPPAPRLARTAQTRRAGVPPMVAIHVSARKPSSRWPEDRFPTLLRALHEEFGARFRLLWSPGAEDDPRHPGDDGKARRIAEACAALPLEKVVTRELPALIDALARCQAIVCSDGGAMHLAAALGMPVTCFFGDSNAGYWRPWGVPFRVLQPASRDVRDVSVAQARAAFRALWSSGPP
jgi:ADP-heptose:LPS heptosyltransferase